MHIARASPNRTVQPHGADHIRNVVPELCLFLAPLARRRLAAQRLHGGAICLAASGHWPTMQGWPLLILMKLRFCETVYRRRPVTDVTPVGRQPEYLSRLGWAAPPATELRHFAKEAVRTKRAKQSSRRPPSGNWTPRAPAGDVPLVVRVSFAPGPCIRRAWADRTTNRGVLVSTSKQ